MYALPAPVEDQTLEGEIIDESVRFEPQGAALLNRVHAALTRYVVLPSPEAADAVVLWLAASHCLPALGSAPRLVINSPEKRCGKSRLLDMVEALSHEPLPAMDMTAPALFKSLGGVQPPTILMDEADLLFNNARGGRGHAEVRAILNAGFQRGRFVVRCGVGANAAPLRYPTFAMVAVAGIGYFPDTLTDRGINIIMRRRAVDEQVEPYEAWRDEAPLHGLREALVRYLAPRWEELRHLRPAMPVTDRAADVWRPLVAVADLVGGSWGERARAACVKLCARAKADEEGQEHSGIRLLADIREVFGHRAELSSADLVCALNSIPESPWKFTAAKLGRALRMYEVESRQIRPGGGGRSEKQCRGYRLADFQEAFRRFVPSEV